MNGKKDVALNTWAIFFYFFSQWILTILITRIAGYSMAGQYSLGVSFANVFSFIGIFGVRSFQIGDVKQIYSDGQYFVFRFISSSAALVLFAFTLVLRNYSHDVMLCCVAVMGFKTLECWNDCVTGTMQRSGKFFWIAVSYTMKGIFPLGAFVLAIIKTQNLPISVAAMSMAYLAVQLFYDIPRIIQMCGKNLRPKISGVDRLVITCFPLMLTSVLDAVLVYLPRDAIEKALGSAALGYYSTISIIVVVLSTLGSGIWGAVAPSLSAMINENRWTDLRKSVQKIYAFIFIVSVLALFAGKLFGPFFFGVIFGSEILEHTDLLVPVLLNAILLLINSFFQYILIPLNHRSALLFTNIGAVVVCLLLEVPLISRWDILGASLGLTSALTLRMIVLYGAYRFYLSERECK